MPKLPIRPRRKPPLTVKQILDWADAFRARLGRWPHLCDGELPEVPGQTWAAIDRALTVGTRGLPGGTTLAKLLLTCRGRRHWHLPPDLSVEQVLGWADAHHARTGAWPSGQLGEQVRGAPKGTTWVAIELALHRGKRGLPQRSSIAQLLAVHRGVRNRMAVPDLNAEEILTWADNWCARSGRWPKYQQGAIPDAPGETWAAVDTALFRGHRGLPCGNSLVKFLAKHRGVRNRSALPHLVVAKVRRWAAVHKKRTGRWPNTSRGRWRTPPARRGGNPPGAGGRPAGTARRVKPRRGDRCELREWEG